MGGREEAEYLGWRLAALSCAATGRGAAGGGRQTSLLATAFGVVQVIWGSLVVAQTLLGFERGLQVKGS